MEAGAMIANCGVDLETKSGGATFFESLGRMFGMTVPPMTFPPNCGRNELDETGCYEYRHPTDLL